MVAAASLLCLLLCFWLFLDRRQSSVARINPLMNGPTTQRIHTFNKHTFNKFRNRTAADNKRTRSTSAQEFAVAHSPGER